MMGKYVQLIAIAMLLLTLASFPKMAKAQHPYASSYEYLTIAELTPFGERLPFWHEDTLEGMVQSNDSIKIWENPVFLDTVSTSANAFIQGPGYNPQCAISPVFNAPRVALPTQATEIREAAFSMGLYFPSYSGSYAHRLVFCGNRGWEMYCWQMGTPFDSTMGPDWIGPPQEDAFFVNGYLELCGEVMGRVVVGAKGHPDPDSYLGYHCIRLIDDLRYWFADPITGAFNDTTGGYEDMITVVSESNITIGNTWANGRENSAQGSDIVITASLVALGNDSLPNYWGSFSFEDQNEPAPDPIIWEYFTGNYSCPTPPTTDERGNIYLTGAITQRRRGYVHRSNHGGTGYGKVYRYDNRFKTQDLPWGIKVRHMPVLLPGQINFVEVEPNTSQTIDLYLLNEGGTYIDIEWAYTNTALFSIAQIAPFTLNPEEYCSFEITFSPTIVGDYIDTLTIELQYGDDLHVPLTGECVAPGINDVEIPSEYGISLFPNPFNSQLLITFDQQDPVKRLSIYDIAGNLIENANAGSLQRNSYTWQPDDIAGGIYFVAIETQKTTQTHKVVYLK